MKAIRSLLLIDGNALGYEANAGRKLTTEDGKETHAIYGIMKKLRIAIASRPGAKPIVYWDGKSWRKNVYSVYKSDRDDDPEQAKARAAYKEQRPDIFRMLKALGVSQRIAANLEADDLIALAVHEVDGRMPIGIMTGDRDLLQLVSPSVRWITKITKGNKRVEKVVDHESFEFETGYRTSLAFVQSKALIGDKGDTLDGVPNIGKVTAQKMLQEFDTVEDLVAHVHSGAPLPDSLKRATKAIIAFIETGLPVFERNMRLMHLTPKTIPAAVKLTKVDEPLDVEAFKHVCASLDFVGTLKHADDFLEPFLEYDYNKRRTS